MPKTLKKNPSRPVSKSQTKPSKSESVKSELKQKDSKVIFVNLEKPKISYANSIFSRYTEGNKIITIEINNNNGIISGKYTEEDKSGKILKTSKITQKNIDKYEKLIR